MKRTRATRVPRTVPPGQLRRTLEAIRRFRTHFVFGTLLLFFILLLGRLVKLQFIEGAHYQDLANRRHSGTWRVTPTRGRIVDRNGWPMATDRDARTVAMDLHEDGVRDPERFSQHISALLGGDPSANEIERKIRSRRALAEAEGRSPPRYVVLRRQIDDPLLIERIDTVGAMRASRLIRAGMYGLIVERQGIRTYPNRHFAAQVLGEVPQRNPKPDAKGRLPSRVGIEGRFDDHLAGRSRELSVRRATRRGRTVNLAESGVDPKDARGGDVALTIDLVVQDTLEKALDAIVERDGPSHLTGVVLDPWTGEVLAMASRPNFVPGRQPYRMNFALQGRWELGSVFKPVTVALALEDGIIDASTSIPMPKRTMLPGDDKPINDTHQVPPGTLIQLISESSNTGAAWLAHRAGVERVKHWWARLGLESASGIELPHEALARRGFGDRWTPHAIHRLSFGQGFSVSPLRMACLLSAFARGDGYAINPRIVRHDPLRDPRGARICSQENAALVSAGMQACVQDGTLEDAFDGARHLAAGKTGTSQFRAPTPSNICTVAAYAPAHAPQVVVLISGIMPVDETSGAGLCGAAVRDVLDATLDYWQVPAAQPRPPISFSLVGAAVQTNAAGGRGR